MALNETALNGMLNWLASTAAYASVHYNDPGTTGAYEVTGAPYARKPISWNSATGTSLSMASDITFDIPPENTITHAGLWDSVTGGTFLGGSKLSDPELFGITGTYTLNAMALGLD